MLTPCVSLPSATDMVWLRALGEEACCLACEGPSSSDIALESIWCGLRVSE